MILRIWAIYACTLVILWGNGALASTEIEFEAFKQRIQKALIQAGVDAQRLHTIIPAIQYSKRVSHAKELNQSHYLSKPFDISQIEAGQQRLLKHHNKLAKISAQYQVSPSSIIAIWGLESQYGEQLNRVNAFDVWMTLAFHQQNDKTPLNQLKSAFKLIDRVGINWQTMTANEKGELGQTHFKPDEYLKYAIDGNNNGKINLWHETDDVLHSIANHLAKKGWQKGNAWGVQVIIPKDYDLDDSGLDTTLPISHFHKRGIRKPDNTPVYHSEAHRFAKASLFVAEPHQSAAFLVYDNFYTLVQWKQSIPFALATGLLIDAIKAQNTTTAGATTAIDPIEKPPQRAHKFELNSERIKQCQAALNQRGFEAGPVDGLMGPLTRRAIRKFQKANNMKVDGQPSALLFTKLSLPY